MIRGKKKKRILFLGTGPEDLTQHGVWDSGFQLVASELCCSCALSPRRWMCSLSGEELCPPQRTCRRHPSLCTGCSSGHALPPSFVQASPTHGRLCSGLPPPGSLSWPMRLSAYSPPPTRDPKLFCFVSLITPCLNELICFPW